MAAIVPILKALLPHVTQIATIAIPAFTKKPPVATVDPVVARQIEELQAAVTHNAESIQVLAEQLQRSLEGIDQGAAVLQAEIVRLRRVVWIVGGVAVAALVLALWLVLGATR
jgi:hypothetical protein